MEWLLLVIGVSAVKDPDVGMKALSMMILITSFVFPLVPFIFSRSERFAYTAIMRRNWANAGINLIALSGVFAVGYVGITRPLVDTSFLAVSASLASMVAGLLLMQFAKRCEKRMSSPDKQEGKYEC